MSLAAGRLRQRIALIRVTEVDDGRGGSVTTLTPIGEQVPAEVLGISGREAVLEKVLTGVRVYQVTTRWRAGVGEKDQVVYAGDTLNIRSAVDPDGRRERLVIIADTAGTLP